jgi:phospholipase C
MHPSALVGLLAFAAAASAIPSSHHRAHSSSSIHNLKSKIKNVVVLAMENRSLDNLLGGQKHKGIENPINNGPFCNPYNVTDPSQGHHCAAPRDYNSVTNDPSHAVTGNTMEFFSTWTPDNALIASGKLVANNNGFIHEQIHNYGSSTNKSTLAEEVMNYYTEDEVPVMTSLVKNFLTFNHWHSDVAGVSETRSSYLYLATHLLTYT